MGKGEEEEKGERRGGYDMSKQQSQTVTECRGLVVQATRSSVGKDKVFFSLHVCKLQLQKP